MCPSERVPWRHQPKPEPTHASIVCAWVRESVRAPAPTVATLHGMVHEMMSNEMAAFMCEEGDGLEQIGVQEVQARDHAPARGLLLNEMGWNRFGCRTQPAALLDDHARLCGFLPQRLLPAFPDLATLRRSRGARVG